MYFKAGGQKNLRNYVSVPRLLLENVGVSNCTKHAKHKVLLNFFERVFLNKMLGMHIYTLHFNKMENIKMILILFEVLCIWFREGQFERSPRCCTLTVKNITIYTNICYIYNLVMLGIFSLAESTYFYLVSY